jgi:4-amino-4-deoxy-L-arabinose transferase-like glycosyltransferase
MDRNNLMENKSSYWFFGNRYTFITTVILAFALGLGIRLFDLTDLPLDFAPTRQMFSVLKARSMYYAMLPADAAVPLWQREMAARQSTAVIEPPVIEIITALTYRVVGEYVWIARIYSSLFWVLAGVFLFLLAREMTSNEGAVISLLFYLFLPYGVLASRSFQPDPLMTALIVAAAWALYRWHSLATWKSGLSAGLLMGLAILVKNVAAFPLGMAALAVFIEHGWKHGWRVAFKDRQTWIVAMMALLPATLYIVYGFYGARFLVGQNAFRFFPELWSSGEFYLRWLGQIDAIVGFGAFAFALAGLFIAEWRTRIFLVGLWLGYFAFGMAFDYHIITHDYYNLMLIPLVALSLAPVTQMFVERARTLQLGRFPRAFFVMLVILVLAIQLWTVRVELVRENWRPDAEFWTMLGEKLGHDQGPVLAITQDYGYRLAYWGWQDVDSWYYSGDLDLRVLDNRTINTGQRFLDRLQGRRFFVVTQMKNFDEQPEIKAYIYEHYPIYAQGRGYIIFDLAAPLPSPTP